MLKSTRCFACKSDCLVTRSSSTRGAVSSFLVKKMKRTLHVEVWSDMKALFIHVWIELHQLIKGMLTRSKRNTFFR